jgi:hypothetical protein
MRPALALFGYALAVAWGAPPLLSPLTRHGVSVRLGLAAWLAAMASVLVSAALAILFLIRTVAADWPTLTQALCRSVAGRACTPVVYRSALYSLGVAALAALVTVVLDDPRPAAYCAAGRPVAPSCSPAARSRFLTARSSPRCWRTSARRLASEGLTVTLVGCSDER